MNHLHTARPAYRHAVFATVRPTNIAEARREHRSTASESTHNGATHTSNAQQSYLTSGFESDMGAASNTRLKNGPTSDNSFREHGSATLSFDGGRKGWHHEESSDRPTESATDTTSTSAYLTDSGSHYGSRSGSGSGRDQSTAPKNSAYGSTSYSSDAWATPSSNMVSTSYPTDSLTVSFKPSSSRESWSSGSSMPTSSISSNWQSSSQPNGQSNSLSSTYSSESYISSSASYPTSSSASFTVKSSTLTSSILPSSLNSSAAPSFSSWSSSSESHLSSSPYSTSSTETVAMPSSGISTSVSSMSTHTRTLSSTITITPTYYSSSVQPTPALAPSTTHDPQPTPSEETHPEPTINPTVPRFTLDTHVSSGPLASFSAPHLTAQTLTDMAQVSANPNPGNTHLISHRQSMGTESIVGAAVGAPLGALLLLVLSCLLWRKCTRKPEVEPLAFDKDTSRTQLPDEFDENDLLDPALPETQGPLPPLPAHSAMVPKPHSPELALANEWHGAPTMDEHHYALPMAPPQVYAPEEPFANPYAHLDRGRVPYDDQLSSPQAETSALSRPSPVSHYSQHGIAYNDSYNMPLGSSDWDLSTTNSVAAVGSTELGRADTHRSHVSAVPAPPGTMLYAHDQQPSSMSALAEERYSGISTDHRSVGSAGKAFESSIGQASPLHSPGISFVSFEHDQDQPIPDDAQSPGYLYSGNQSLNIPSPQMYQGSWQQPSQPDGTVWPAQQMASSNGHTYQDQAFPGHERPYPPHAVTHDRESPYGSVFEAYAI